MNVNEFLASYLVIGLLNGLIIYIVFYLTFQKLVASKTPEERGAVSALVVMGGFIYDEVPRQSVTQMVRDIFARALGRGRLQGWGWVFQGISKWFALALIALSAMVIVSLICGW